MRYYIRQDKNAEVQGPFTIETLTEAILASRIAAGALASSDLREGNASLQVWRRCDWFPLAAISELRGVVPPLPEPPPKPRRVSVFEVLCNLGGALTFSYMAITERRWYVIVLSVVMVYCAMDTIFSYIKQRVKGGPAV